MGNWCTLTTWFACPRPGDARAVLGCLRDTAPRHRWIDRERWGLRAGLLAPSLVQAESVEKYGASCSLAELVKRHVAGVQVVQLCPGERIAAGPITGPGFGLAWNYVVAPATHDLAAVAECLGHGAVSLDFGRWRVLCLPEPAPLQLADGPFADVVMRDDPLGRLAYAFAIADPHARGRTTWPLLGLYTPTHGWVHMVTMSLHLPPHRWEHEGLVSLEDGACRNPVRYELAIGPCVLFLHEPTSERLALTGLRWPG